MSDDEQDTQLTRSLRSAFIAVGKPPKRLQYLSDQMQHRRVLHNGQWRDETRVKFLKKKTLKVLTKNNMHFDSDAFSWATRKCLLYNGSEEVEKVKKT